MPERQARDNRPGKAQATEGYVQLAARPVFAPVPVVPPGTADLTLTGNAALRPGSYGNVTVTAGKTLTLSPGLYNLNSISLTGNSVVTTNPAGQVIINIAGQKCQKAIDLGGGSLSHPTGIPLNLAIDL